MPPSRIARQSTIRENPHARDGEGDTEPEEDAPTPRQMQRTMSKKRLSDVYAPDHEDSFTSDSGRAPLQSVNINDDMAEKRRRRKSAKVAMAASISDTAEAGPSSSSAAAEQGGAEASTGTTAQARQKQQLLSVAQAPIINVPLDVMSSNFEEWMKMATDNKINAANSWNFALIDYFHDMSLLRNNTDNSINFQRASCTLDGCVKIWTSRVDSVGTETGKLLSNLANEGRPGDDDGAASDNPDGQEPGQSQRKRKTHRPESTLAKSLTQLRSKKLDLEFTVDPLFRKTCADFDEGGAQGLLMNHLSLGEGPQGSLRVVFDASDAMGAAGDEDEPLMEPEDLVDLSYLRKQFLPDMDALDGMAVCQSLEGFSFAKDFSFDDTTLFRDQSPNFDDGGDDDEPDGFGGDDPQDLAAPMEMDGDQNGPPVEDFFVGDQAITDDYVPGDFAPGDDMDPNSQPDGSDAPSGERVHTGAFRDLVMAMTEGGEGGLMMDYFDQNFLKNWAGPEHWKLRRVVRRPEASEAAPKLNARRRRHSSRFLTPSEKDPKTIAKELFVPVTRGAGITLPGSSSAKGSSRKGSKRKSAKDKERERRTDQTLPDDMHFSSRQLVTLFLKPEFSLKMRGRRVQARGDGEIDENFWAQAAAEQAAGRAGEDGDESANDGGIPFNTQFFHDDFDEAGGFDDVFDGADGANGTIIEPGEQDLLAATQGLTRRVRPEFVNYAKRAKRVDVRKLKENIWKGLDIVVPKADDFAEEDDAMDVDDRPATDPDEPREFTSVISGLQKTYPKDKLEEISTSFCFICLLHLANERGLKIRSDEADEGAVVEEEERKVGRIWDLKVYRDPEA
ncbi:condensin complex subunit 2/barren [Fomitopsis serialis]|uniref:condensin complex subunit 2/barren n=1 Tax=Fomitopsis serialis TaxID=139415 RepID=UPI00200822E0|nr:condensin complex subunit 2/barren [Neoantrodia serialis]KAH9933294.1 condensin complex subunit 2/barren [Neoantrodia serialis]